MGYDSEPALPLVFENDSLGKPYTYLRIFSPLTFTSSSFFTLNAPRFCVVVVKETSFPVALDFLRFLLCAKTATENRCDKTV